MAAVSHASLRAQLLSERERLAEQLAQMSAGAEGRLDFDEGFADSGQVTAERGEVEALTGTLSDTLQDIDDALARFEGGTYGRCEACGGPIAEARLEAMPAARLCITCASKSR